MTPLLDTRLGRALRTALAPAGSVAFTVLGDGRMEVVARSARGRAVGRIRVELSEGSARLSGLRVAALWRGRGIGRALLERACAEAAARGARVAALAVSARNGAARRLYADGGFAAREPARGEEWLRAL
ncbi:MAG: GNAT family N-acetyltransferase [Planctomycetales bacterium]|nr:GNAT family N-acetyltransferase [Planctomycetales bacterium]